jgi:hypothetical protein
MNTTEFPGNWPRCPPRASRDPAYERHKSIARDVLDPGRHVTTFKTKWVATQFLKIGFMTGGTFEATR